MVAYILALRRRRRVNNELFFPDDIIIQILSWLPAIDVLRYRCGCSKWKELTSTRDFTDLHLGRSLSLILKKDYVGLDMLDGCWERARKTPEIKKLYEPNGANDGLMVTGGGVISHNGLIVTNGGTYKDRLIREKGVVIYNPIYSGDAVHIIAPEKCHIYGVFFHPVQKEYCTLWRITLSHEPWKVQYRILNLESNTKWRDIKNPCTQNAKLMDPVLIDKYLYWMVEPYQHYKISDKISFNCDIMEYDIANEEFRLITCPVRVNMCNHYYNVNLIDNGGAVSLVQVFPSKKMVKITIWTLKDSGKQLWIRSNYMVSSDVYPGYGVPKAVAFRNGELVLQSDARLYICNLKQGTYRKFGEQYKHEVRLRSHVTSLVSLRNCKSKICIGNLA